MKIQLLSEASSFAAQTAHLLFREWSALPAWSNQSAILQRLNARNDSAHSEFTLVAEHADKVIATSSVIRYELNDALAREYWLGEVVTDSAFRGQGIAKSLISRCVTLAKQNGIKALWLYTPDQQAFYQRLGWQAVEQRVIADEEVTLMVLSLDSSQ